MKPNLMFFLLLFVPKHGVVSGINQLCILIGQSKMLFANVTLDGSKRRWALYFSDSGVTQPRLVAIWGLENSTAKMDYNDNSNINMDRTKNIWINNIGEEDEGNYSIKYIVDNSAGPQVKLTVFELAEKKQYEECNGNHPQLPAPTNENMFVAVTNGSILTTTFPGKSEYLIPSAEKNSSETSPMMPIILAIVGLILVILLIAAIYWLWKKCRTKRTYMSLRKGKGTSRNDVGELKNFSKDKLENGSNPNKLLRDERDDGQLPAVLETRVLTCAELTRQMDDHSNQSFVAKGGEHVESQPQSQLQTVLICDKLTQQLDDLKHQLSSTKDESGKDLAQAQSPPPILRCDELSKQLNDLRQQLFLAKGADVTENSYMCKICFANPTRIVFMPCGHHMTCQDCANRMTTCPLCKETIRAMLETYSG